MRTLWEGNVPLVKVFWQWGVLGRVILGIPVFFIGFLVARGALFSPGAISIIVVYDLLGREVARLVDENLSPGKYSIVWSGVDKFGNSVASGIYFYSLRTGTFSNTRKMILLR